MKFKESKGHIFFPSISQVEVFSLKKNKSVSSGSLRAIVSWLYFELVNCIVKNLCTFLKIGIAFLA